MSPELHRLRAGARLPLWVAYGIFSAALIATYFALGAGTDAQAAV